MDKRIKFSDQPRKVKIVYSAVIAVLCVTAIVIGIVSAANRNNDMPEDEPTVNVPSEDENKQDETDETPKDEEKEEEKPEKLTFVSPVVGQITKGHSIETPVFSDTLQEWRVHTGIDISAEEGAEVFAAADGKVSRVFSDPFLGKTVEITHDGGIVSVYSNLSSADVAVKEGDTVKSGALIGYVGDTSLSELADEAHLHFALKVEGVSVNPLDYISEESKEASLGISQV
ncbi:MAG: M23 family metallopeptidase [Clostridia bacterium]|nr:M23 family metallopeptidase [Clostridia bacterium]